MTDEGVSERLVRMETKLDALIEKRDDHEERLRVVEKKVWAASGVAALLGGGGATMLQLILTKGA